MRYFLRETFSIKLNLALEQVDSTYLIIIQEQVKAMCALLTLKKKKKLLSINKIIVKYQFLISRSYDMLDKLGEFKLFSKIDLNNRYHQFRICPDGQ